MGADVINTPQSVYTALCDAIDDQRLPPVHLWRPERSGQIDIRIRTDGRWFHEGQEIKRQALVKVLASVMRCDPDGFCLVTPAERLLIQVDDAPFVACAMDVKAAGQPDQELLFTTNIGELVIANAQRPIVVTYENPRDPEEPRPYIEVRDGIQALISRNVFYQMVELAEEREGGLVLRSAGATFKLGALT